MGLDTAVFVAPDSEERERRVIRERGIALDFDGGDGPVDSLIAGQRVIRRLAHAQARCAEGGCSGDQGRHQNQPLAAPESKPNACQVEVCFMVHC